MKQKILSLLLFGLLGITTALAQEREITGKVTDNTGAGLPGAAVIIENTTTGTSTDDNGMYKIKASTGTVLVFTMVGYPEKKVTVGASNVIDVRLEEGKVLTDVVLTGYREIAREKSTGSTFQVGAKDIQRTPSSSFENALQGRTTGVLVGTPSGQPGSASSVLIRGRGSVLGGTAPLYVMDGVAISAGDFSALNSNDIESMTVLKDASSASLYGSRGANGVIVIRTKRGKGKARISYNTQHGVSMRTTPKFANMNTSERLEFERILAEDDFKNGRKLFENVRTVGVWTNWLNAGSPASGTEVEERDRLLNELRGTDTDWAREFFRTGNFQSHDFSISGGEDKTKFYVGMQYRKDEGILIKSDLERYTLRANISHDASEKFKFGLNSSIGYSKNRFIESEGLNLDNPVLSVYIALPYNNTNNPKSDFIFNRHPTITRDVQNTLVDNYKSVASVFAEYQITKDISIRTSWGGDLSMDITKANTLPPKNSQDDNDPNQAGLGETGRQGSLSRRQNLNISMTGTTSLKYDKNFGNHNVSVMLINEFFARNVSSFNYTGYGINPKFAMTPRGITQVSGGPNGGANGFNTIVGGGFTHNRIASILLDAQYSFSNRYNATLAIRRDGSSRFGENKRYGTFGAVGASWNVHNETFFSAIQDKFVDALTVRATYGTQGNQPTGDFDYLAVYGPGGNYGGASGLIPGNPANPDLQWEQQATLNLGVDFSLFKGRFTGAFEFYNRKTTNLFLASQLSRTSGTASITKNVGSMRNRGIEINLAGEILKIGNFSWNAQILHTINRNKVLDLGVEKDISTGSFGILNVGIPYGTISLPKWAGVDPATGDPLFYDLEGNVTTQYSESFNQNVGLTIAPHFGSITNTFAYKGIELSVLCSYEADKDIVNVMNFFNYTTNQVPIETTNRDARMLNVWRTPGQVTDIPRLGSASQYSTREIEDGSFLRVRNVTLAYSIPKNFLSNIKINAMRVYAVGQNLFTLTRFTGFDPETGNGDNKQATYPVPRTIIFGLDVTF